VYEQWDRKRREEAGGGGAVVGVAKRIALQRTASEASLARGKGKAKPELEEEEDAGSKQAESGDLVVFACRHVWHRKCLDTAITEGGGRMIDGRDVLSCPLLHGHG
jgi:hypothetical protein